MAGLSAMGELVLILLSLCSISGIVAGFSEVRQLMELKNAIVEDTRR